MYSRAVTLDKVHRTEFSLLYKTMNDYKAINKENIKEFMAPLITPNGYAYFHVAIVTEQGCVETAESIYNKPFLCDTFKNSNKIETLLESDNHIGFIEKRSKEVMQNETISQSYLFQKFKNSNTWMVAKTNFYKEHNKTYFVDQKISHFIYFMTHRYYQANSIYKIYDKGKYIGLVVFMLSLTLWLINKRRYRIHLNKYKKMKSLEEQQNNQLLDQIRQYDLLKEERYEKSEAIEALENELSLVRNKSKEHKKITLASIIELKKEKDELDGLLQGDEDIIQEIEKESRSLQETINKQLTKLDEYEKGIENKKIREKFSELELLWRHEPSWIDRRKIESNVTLIDSHLPFTITQGFIVFEKLMFDVVKKDDPTLDENSTNLGSNIHMIFEKGLLPNEYRYQCHGIRIARNKWFHSGVFPTLAVTDDLMDILQKVDVAPII